jgi:membrane-associated phospholipid phosphatase
VLLTFGLTQIGQAWQDRGLHAWDVAVLLQVAHAGPMTFANGVTWQAPGDLLFQPVFVLVFVALAAWWSRPLIAATMAASYVLAFVLIWTGWGLWNRTRPDLIANGIAAPPLHSFPSGHMVLSAAIYGLVAYLWMRASRSWIERVLVLALFLAVVVLVGIARLALGSHWPSDILAGSFIGLAWLAATIAALRAAERRVGQT